MAEYVSKYRVDNMNAFACAVWGNVEAVLKRDHRVGVHYIDLTEFLDAFEFLFGSAIQNPRILVRKEYVTALHELETNVAYRQAAYVTGQPGIGKTLFLAYVLVVCLWKRRPVALELSTGSPFYIVFRHTVTFHSAYDTKPLDEYGPLWALSDSSERVRSPNPIFYGLPSRVRTIQSTSPRENRWKEWSKQAHAECYVMDIWTEGEIADLAKLLDLDVEGMTALARSFGGVPRRLLRFLGMPEHEIEGEYRDDAGLAVQECRVTLSAILHKNLVEEGPSNFYFCRPRETELGIDRKRTCHFVPTPALRRLLGEALQQQDNAIRLDFFRALSQPSETRPAAESIFKSWFHVYISAAKSIECHWVQGLGGVSRLTGTSTLVPTICGAGEVAKPPYYWVAPKNFPGVDGALVLDSIIYAFQVTISSRHRSPLDGLQTLRDHLPAALKNLPWRVVFIGDSDDAIKAAAHSWVGKFSFPAGQVVPIGWSVVDPVMDDVPYQELREASDPDDHRMNGSYSSAAVVRIQGLDC